MKRTAIGLMILVVGIAGLGWGGFKGVKSVLVQRYDKLTRASDAALDKGDIQGAARLATAALQGLDLPFLAFNNDRAQGLLRDALMTGQAPLTEISTAQFPQFSPTGDVVPMHAAVASDGTRLMIMHNESRYKWIVDIDELPSGRLIRQFPWVMRVRMARR